MIASLIPFACPENLETISNHPKKASVIHTFNGLTAWIPNAYLNVLPGGNTLYFIQL